MRNLRTDAELTQEVLRRGEIYKKKRTRRIMSVSACLVIAACASVFAFSGRDGLQVNDTAFGGLIFGDNGTDAYDGDPSGYSYGDPSGYVFNTDSTGDAWESWPFDDSIASNDASAPYAEIYFEAETSADYASVDPAIASRLIESAIDGALSAAPSGSVTAQNTVSRDGYRIVIFDGDMYVYYLKGNTLTDKSSDTVYTLAQSDSDALRESIDTLMKGR